jgi:predicted  nucleic acid-binding Zn-ribbon protein
VPPWSGEGEELDEVTEEERHRVELEDMLAQLQGRIEALETQRTASDLCLARIGDEIGLIQDALDRITEVVESRRAER